MESGSFGRYISIYPIEDEDQLHGNPMLVFPEYSVYMYEWLASRLWPEHILLIAGGIHI